MSRKVKKEEIKYSCELMQTGEIILLDNDISINKNLEKKQVIQSILYKDYLNSTQDMENGYFWLRFNPINLFGVQIKISMCFKEENLFSVNMYIIGSDFPTSWYDWTEEGELKRKKLHDVFLKEIFQRKPDKNIRKPYPSTCFNFKWGEVCSIFDIRSGSSSISIKYRNEIV